MSGWPCQAPLGESPKTGPLPNAPSEGIYRAEQPPKTRVFHAFGSLWAPHILDGPLMYTPQRGTHLVIRSLLLRGENQARHGGPQRGAKSVIRTQGVVVG